MGSTPGHSGVPGHLPQVPALTRSQSPPGTGASSGRKGAAARGSADRLHPPCLGFYELSDGGSCSLSASRTSVCSDRVYSLGTLLPADPTARPRSADDTTVHGAPLPTCRPQATEEGECRPRPVSTGKGEPGRREAPLQGWGRGAGEGAAVASLSTEPEPCLRLALGSSHRCPSEVSAGFSWCFDRQESRAHFRSLQQGRRDQKHSFLLCGHQKVTVKVLPEPHTA